MVYIPQPQNRESLLAFGDGDIAIFGKLYNSDEEGYYLVKFRPTANMRHHHQIQDKEYHPYDRWIYKKYKKDLCIELNHDPDFPVWAIMCDYNGGEDTPLLNIHKRLIEKNRELDSEIKLYKTALNIKRRREREKLERPEEHELEMYDRVARFRKATGEPAQQQQVPIESEAER